MTPRRRRLLAPGINLAPILDAVLNLLFFFLLATTLKKKEAALEVSLPSARSARSAEGGARPIFQVDSEGTVHYLEEPLTGAALDSEIRRMVRDGILEIDIEGDRAADYGRIVEIMDLCKSAGMRAANLRADRDRPPDEESPER